MQNIMASMMISPVSLVLSGIVESEPWRGIVFFKNMFVKGGRCPNERVSVQIFLLRIVNLFGLTITMVFGVPYPPPLLCFSY